MSENPTTRLNPVLLTVVGVLVLVAVGVGIVMVAKPFKKEEIVEEGGKGASKKSSRSGGSSGTGGARNSQKSDGVREGTRPEQGAGSRTYGSDIEQMFVEVSVSAREELKQLRDKHKTEYDDPEERRAFGVTLSQITDPTERQAALRERTEAMRRARARVDAGKTMEDREREKQLIVLMQVQNLSRMSEFVGKNPNLRSDTEDFDVKLAEWVQASGEMDNNDFHATFNTLRDQLNDLRRRNAQHTGTEAKPANLPSRRPERQAQP